MYKKIQNLKRFETVYETISIHFVLNQNFLIIKSLNLQNKIITLNQFIKMMKPTQKYR